MPFPSLTIGNLIAPIPIIQGGMGINVSMHRLAAAVASEGGIGVISSAGIALQEKDVNSNKENANIRALVDRAFRTDTKGQLKTAAVLELMRIDIDDAEWKRAMAAIRDSIQTTGTATYVRVYRRVGASDQYEAVPLDLAAV